ncbi:MAG: Adaptive-response sensory-kinase SasA [Phycisphaerae bacterium]|nr:Adaptive-response sensory-kinase SasA [Phycisphaerae bacterium]
MSETANRRIIVIDDNVAIHDDFRKILCGDARADAELDALEAQLFSAPRRADERPSYELEFATQGQEGLERIRAAASAGRPFALAFIDGRMPPGWDGIETASRIWEEFRDLQIVICTAYTDHSWSEVANRLGNTDKLLILKKPFENVEVRQLAACMTQKWTLSRQAQQRVDELEGMVRERTQALEAQSTGLQRALDQLQQAQAQLLHADKMASIGQLAAGVAHEINNPIGFIASNLTSLGEYVDDLKRVLSAFEELSAECRAAGGAAGGTLANVERVRGEVDLDFIVGDVSNLVEESIEGARRVKQIVADLRDFSHVDTPDVTTEDLNALIDRTLTVATNEIKYRANVVREYGELPAIQCYGGKLGQVVLNLVVNAAQAIAEQGTITIRTGAAGGEVWFEVQDTGCGIPPENLPRIFEPFFTTKDVGRGTGLGLHVTYAIVQAHGGRIDVRSRVGEGTCFRITLPTTLDAEKLESTHVAGR